MSHKVNDILLENINERLEPVIACPYCYDIKARGHDRSVVEPSPGCCHESSAHFDLAYEYDDGTVVLSDELAKFIESEFEKFEENDDVREREHWEDR